MTVLSKTALPDIFLLPEWGKAYASQDKGEAQIFEFKNEVGHIFYQFVLRPVPTEAGSPQYFDTITPFGLNGPIIVDCLPGYRERLVELFDQEFQQYCEDQNIISEYIRFNPWLGNIRDFGHLYGIDHRGITMYIDLTTPDFFMDEFKSGTRQQVRRALKNGVEVEYDYTGATLEDFSRLYKLMAEKNNIPEYYLFTEDFLRQSFDQLEGRQFIINAKHEGKSISTALFLHYGDYLHYHLAANDPAYFKFAGNSLILHEACRWGVENGKKEMHLGGASTGPLQRFKSGFTKTEPLEILTGKKIRMREAYDSISNAKLLRDEIENPSHFPLYRG